MTKAPWRSGLRPRVPWIVPWSSERIALPQVARRGLRGERLGYRTECLTDRSEGVLWARMPWPWTQGVGAPHIGDVHPLRQRAAMQWALCENCGLPAWEQTPYPIVLMPVQDRSVQAGDLTANPPIHEKCVREAIHTLPRLRAEWVTAYAWLEPWGVEGTLYDPDTLQPLPGTVRVPYTDEERLPWILASRAVSRLTAVIEPDDT